MVLRWFGGPEGCAKQLRRACEQPVDVHILEATGHWVQQERPEALTLPLPYPYPFLNPIPSPSLALAI